MEKVRALLLQAKEANHLIIRLPRIEEELQKTKDRAKNYGWTVTEIFIQNENTIIIHKEDLI